jgi:hypothetical protein
MIFFMIFHEISLKNFIMHGLIFARVDLAGQDWSKRRQVTVQAVLTKCYNPVPD